MPSRSSNGSLMINDMEEASIQLRYVATVERTKLKANQGKKRMACNMPKASRPVNIKYFSKFIFFLA